MKTDSTYTLCSKLAEQHRRFQTEHDAQSNDYALIEQEYNLQVATHQRLKDRIHEQEVTLTALDLEAPRQGGGGTSEGELPQLGAPHAQDPLAEESAEDSAQKKSSASALTRIRALLDTEANSLRSVRTAHLEALRQRTELEVHLLHSIQTQQKLKRESDATPANRTVVLTAEDRRQVIDRLLSRQRVLQVLYDNTDANTTGEGAINVDGQNDDEVAESIDDLWKRWKSWTAESNKETPLTI